MEMTHEMKIKLAVKMTILDAIEKGHTDKDELIAYMSSETFKKAADNYIELLA